MKTVVTQVKRFKKTIKTFFMKKLNDDFFCHNYFFIEEKCKKRCNECIGLYQEKITTNDALQFIKENHNGEIPYTFGKNEYGRWMAEYANHVLYRFIKSQKYQDVEFVKTCGFCPNCKSKNIIDVDDHWSKCEDCNFRFVG